VLTYLLINLCILAGPFLLSFFPTVKYKEKWALVLLATLPVALVFIVWDAVAVARLDWEFSPERITGYKLFNLPLEEVLFFFTVPFSCLFIWECLNYYFKDRTVTFPRFLKIVMVLVFVTAAFLFRDQYYTSTVLVFCGIFFLISFFLKQSITQSRNFWLMILISYIPFLIFNFLLTSIPVVTYNQSAIWGIRITTIPFEDFFYSFALLALYAESYLIVKKLNDQPS
jgi:lycopene cyclase domain-containing protein